ncbi:MAG: DUF5319 domain-containing protein [Actinomycetota bacterium]|nr:DUF5319 domain-containing protein [Actinomycetota bacterium]
MADEEELEPLGREERDNIAADLRDLGEMRTVFEAQGTRGVVIACPDCGSDHYYDWDLLRESLEHMLNTGEPRMHEPAFEPREEDYVLWDYGKGYVDALSDAGLGRTAQVTVDACPWCRADVQPHFGYCPACGRSLAAARLLQELVARGMEEKEIRALLVRAGFDPFG